ncbi:NUDIX domain-containing protein [Spongorhabdus nitratireducens]
MADNEQRGPWKRLNSRIAYENPWIQVRHEEVITPGGTEGIYGVVSMKGRAVGIIPLDEQNNTWLVRQFRYTINEPTWEIPKGSAEPKESRKQGAIRELKEETGLVAGQLQTLMHIHTSISCTDEATEIFIARNLGLGKPEPDDTEDITVHKLPLKQAIQMALSGEITDSISIAALLKLSSLI